MRQLERIALWSAAAAAIMLSLRAGSAPGSSALAANIPEGGSPKVAVCAVLRVADELMDSDRFKPLRQEYEEQLRKDDLDPLVEQLRELQGKLENMPRDNPEFAQLRDQYLRLQREANAKQQEIVQKMEKKVAEQLAEAYALVRSSATSLADDQGYDFVIASSGPDDELKKETPLALVRDILARPALKFPKDADITEDVRDDLKLR